LKKKNYGGKGGKGTRGTCFVAIGGGKNTRLLQFKVSQGKIFCTVGVSLEALRRGNCWKKFWGGVVFVAPRLKGGHLQGAVAKGGDRGEKDHLEGLLRGKSTYKTCKFIGTKGVKQLVRISLPTEDFYFELVHGTFRLLLFFLRGGREKSSGGGLVEKKKRETGRNFHPEREKAF